MKLYIKSREGRVGGLLQEVFVVVDETGKDHSQPTGSRHYAAKMRDEIIANDDTFEVGKGRLFQTR